MTEFVIDVKLGTPLSPFDSVEAPTNYHVVICQPGGGFIAHDVYVKTNWTLKPPRKVDTDTLARYDETTCRRAEAMLRN